MFHGILKIQCEYFRLNYSAVVEIVPVLHSCGRFRNKQTSQPHFPVFLRSHFQSKVVDDDTLQDMGQ